MEEREKWRWSIKGVEGDIRERERVTAQPETMTKRKKKTRTWTEEMFVFAFVPKQSRDRTLFANK